jgi:hypothetical protein
MEKCAVRVVRTSAAAVIRTLRYDGFRAAL